MVIIGVSITLRRSVAHRNTISHSCRHKRFFDAWIAGHYRRQLRRFVFAAVTKTATRGKSRNEKGPPSKPEQRRENSSSSCHLFFSVSTQAIPYSGPAFSTVASVFFAKVGVDSAAFDKIAVTDVFFIAADPREMYQTGYRSRSGEQQNRNLWNSAAATTLFAIVVHCSANRTELSAVGSDETINQRKACYNCWSKVKQGADCPLNTPVVT